MIHSFKILTFLNIYQILFTIERFTKIVKLIHQ